MALSGEMEEGLKGKGRNAFRNLRAVEENVCEIIDVLRKLESGLKSITPHSETESPSNAKSEGNNNQNCKQKNESEKGKITRCLSDIDGIPKRIEFTLINLKFYIDFTLTAEKDISSDVKGCIIYGIRKSRCFTNCPNICDRIERCDGLKDKPLIHFFVDRSGMIQSSGDFEDNWWIKTVNQDKKDNKIDESLKEILLDLHYRTIELIWPNALNWINENLLT